MSYWQSFWRRLNSTLLLGIPLGGFVIFLMGIGFWLGLNKAIEFSNAEAFCVSCHEMQSVYEEYKQSIHYKNKSGIRASCSDCHVPSHPWTAKILKKIEASNELLHKILGSIDTPEKFEAKRWVLANRVWREMRASDSQECRNCHELDAMDLSKQDRRARSKHTAEYFAGKYETCIDCHPGVAHQIPDGPDNDEFEEDFEGQENQSREAIQ